MHNQSPFVKVVIWLMIFLMSIGFAALVVTPFLGGGSLFGDDGGRGAQEDQLKEARADVERDRCGEEGEQPTGERLDRCKDALQRLASSYRSLATPAEGETEAPRDSQRNIERFYAAYETLYELDPTDEENAEAYAAALRDQGKAEQALPIWATLVKENPNDEDYLLQQAAAFEGAQQLDRAIATYRTFVKKFPESGRIESIEEQIETLEEQQAQGGAAGLGGGAGAGAPITVG